MTPPEIRPLTVADLDAALALTAALPHAPHWPRATWQVMLVPGSLPPRVLLGAFVSSRLAGLAVASLTPPESELESIAVAASFQRQGLARALFAVLEPRLRAAGAASVFLEVRASNMPAQALYCILGFQPAGLRPGYYAEPAEDALVLRRPLA
ncbi:MAG: GNAT family N-acetyltransferase [Terracidiphilus sp.]|nr:GNAT family N-acetyltransferase [Terracidiphilus sp.]